MGARKPQKFSLKYFRNRIIPDKNFLEYGRQSMIALGIKYLKIIQVTDARVIGL